MRGAQTILPLKVSRAKRERVKPDPTTCDSRGLYEYTSIYWVSIFLSFRDG